MWCFTGSLILGTRIHFQVHVWLVFELNYARWVLVLDPQFQVQAQVIEYFEVLVHGFFVDLSVQCVSWCNYPIQTSQQRFELTIRALDKLTCILLISLLKMDWFVVINVLHSLERFIQLLIYFIRCCRDTGCLNLWQPVNSAVIVVLSVKFRSRQSTLRVMYILSRSLCASHYLIGPKLHAIPGVHFHHYLSVVSEWIDSTWTCISSTIRCLVLRKHDSSIVIMVNGL